MDHPPRLHDDLANAVAGVSYLLGSNAKNSRHEFNPSLHIAKERLSLAVRDWPLFVGVSYGDGLAAAVIGQAYGNEIRVFFAAVSEGVSLRRFLEEHARQWLVRNARQIKLNGAFEKSENLEIQSETRKAARDVLAGEWVSIQTPWQIRRDRLLSTLTESQPFNFKPRVQIDATASALSQALNGRLYEKDKAERKHWHVINAFTCLLARIETWKVRPKDPAPMRLPPSWMSS